MFFACAPQTKDEIQNNQPSKETSGSDASGSETSSGNDSTPIDWDVTSDCGICHQKSTETVENLRCEAAQGSQNETCVNCHVDIEGMQKAHEKVNAADTAGDTGRLKRTKVESDVCLTCHNWDDLAKDTAQSTALTDSAGTTVNPHEVTTVNNINGAHDKTGCSDCHKMHSGEPTEKAADAFCLNCHHGGKYECYTCHPPE